MSMEPSDRPVDASETRDNSPRQRRIFFALAPENIALFKAIIESYDNLATLRTEEPRRHLMCLYFSADTESDVRSMLDSLRDRFSMREIHTVDNSGSRV